MLVLTCHPWEVIKIGEALLVVEPSPLSGHHRLMIEAPAHITIGRIRVSDVGPEANNVPAKMRIQYARALDNEGRRHA